MERIAPASLVGGCGEGIFDHIELFYNPNRRHGYAGGLAPGAFEKQHFIRLESVYRSLGDSGRRSDVIACFGLDAA